MSEGHAWASWRRWWWLGAAAFGLVMGLSLLQPTFAIHRDIRNEAVASIVDLDRTYMGDPQPAIVAAARLSRDRRAAIYAPDLSVGSAFIYPPIAALLYRPLIGLSPAEAHAWLAAVNHALFVIIVALMVQLASARRNVNAKLVVLCATAAVAFYPLVHALQLNQATLLVTACVGGAWIALDECRQGLAGILFATAFAIKPQLVVVLPALVWGARRMVASSLATGAALLGLSLTYAGWGNHVDYVTRVLPSLSRGYSYYANQGFNGLLYRLATSEGVAVFRQVPDSPFVRWGTRLIAVGALALVLALGRRWHARAVPVTWTFALAWLCATMTSPIAWQHHYAPALFAAVAVGCALRDEPRLGRPGLGLMIGAAFGLTGAYFEVRQVEGGAAARLLVSYVLYGALALGAGLIVTAEGCAARR